MQSSNRIVLFQAFGGSYYQQAEFAAMHLLRVYDFKEPSFRIVILTDNPSYFKDLTTRFSFVQAVTEPEESMQEWAKYPGYFWRRKIRAIQEFVLRNNADVLYSDNDTIWHKPIEPIFEDLANGYLYMDKRNWGLSRTRQLNPGFLEQDTVLKPGNGQDYVINGDTSMWNAGVVGIGIAQKDVFKEVLEFHDYLYETTQHWICEQFALGIVLEKTGKLKEAAPFVKHYWVQKPQMNDRITREYAPLTSLDAKIRYIRGSHPRTWFLYNKVQLALERRINRVLRRQSA